MTNSLTRVLAWVLRLLGPASRDPHEGRGGRALRPGRPCAPKPAVRRGGWRDFVPPGPAGDDPPVQDSATVVPPYLMTPGELAERRRRYAEAGATEAGATRKPARSDARTRPAHDWAVAARAAGVMA
ncbi:hypothetical protein [Embleya hyalina]|uniref:hypothetical protein n=1 Tax=Embleya hyalina TaxID=516124 RepID=UPI000F822232|nr:hypothetical protein [Embleya hyalina]